MATVHYAAFLAINIIALQSYSATANFTIPFLSPLFGGDPCGVDICGKGKCVASNSSTSGYECDCDQGWKQARSEDDQFFKFLPCIIPNCSLNFHCEEASPPAVDKQNTNFSVFDPCFWGDCGGGSCNRTSPITRTCICDEGYYNLFNSTAFACYKECAIGGDCAAIGLNMFNTSASSPHPGPSVVGDSKGHASSVIPRAEFGWLITMATTLALAFSKYS
ncbi:hypothetical protein ACS0TY_027440 [Phlomoides rotata]